MAPIDNDKNGVSDENNKQYPIYRYSSTVDKIISRIAQFRESGKGTAGTKKAVDDILVAEFGRNLK